MSKEAEFSRTSDRKKISKEVEERNKQLQNLKERAISHIASTPEGRIFLNILMTECGFHEPSLVQNSQTREIVKDALIINEAIRGLYVRLRKLIPKEKLQQIEFLDLKEEAKQMVQENKGE